MACAPIKFSRPLHWSEFHPKYELLAKEKMLLPRLESALVRKRECWHMVGSSAILHSCILAACLVQTDSCLSMKNPYIGKEFRQAREQDLSRKDPRI